MSRADVCLRALQELSNTWTVANLTYGVFSHLLGSNLEGDGGGPPQIDTTGIISGNHPHLQPLDTTTTSLFSGVDPGLVSQGTAELQAMGLLHFGEKNYLQGSGIEECLQ